MIRFLQQLETGSGNDASKRRAWVDDTSLDDIKKQACTFRKSKRPRKR